MSVSIQSNPQVVTAFLDGEIDHHTAAHLREKIDDAVERQKPPLLRLDFTNVTFMDSSGIGLVMGRYRLMQALGGEVEVDNLSPASCKVMKLAGLSKLVRIREKEETKA